MGGAHTSLVPSHTAPSTKKADKKHMNTHHFTFPVGLGMSDTRMLRSRQVGVRAYELARELFNWDEEKCGHMFVLGILHDVGYQFAQHQNDHPAIGGELLRATGYAYWREVAHHGIPGSVYQSDELFILNLADMQTSSTGARVSIGERLDDIASRYGDTSPQYTDACELAGELAERLHNMRGTKKG